MEQPTEEISLEARRHARRLRRALGVLTSIHHRISLAQATTFLHVAWEEGLTVSALASRCGVQPTTISKHLRDLGPINRDQEPGLGLITITKGDYGDQREHFVILTERGTAVARQMIAIMKKR